MPDEFTPSRRVELPYDGNRYQRRDYDVTTEVGARKALADVAARGTLEAKTAVRNAVATHWPNIGKPNKSGSPRDFFPNSNMKD